MTTQRLTLLVAICAMVLVFIAGMAIGAVITTDVTHAYPVAKDSQWRPWAQRWHAQEVRQQKRYAKMAKALGLRPPRRVTRIADHTVTVNELSTGLEIDTMSWRHYGRACKHRAKRLRDYSTPRLWRRMTRPGGSGAARWWPLASYLGWPSSQRTNFVYCVKHESGGNPNAQNSSSGAGGLMQLHPAPSWWRDPARNIRGGLSKWRARGWQPWQVFR